jgi:hypothetical protein
VSHYRDFLSNKASGFIISFSAVDFIVEFCLHIASLTAFEARIAGVAHDREQPYAAVATTKSPIKTERT